MLVNLTPHPINLAGQIIPLSGQLARCSEIISEAGQFDGVSLINLAYGPVAGLPDPQPGTLYIVSALVRLALPGRSDLASPGTLVRDEAGKVVGCQNLVVNH